jgi:hypothetical protein
MGTVQFEKKRTRVDPSFGLRLVGEPANWLSIKYLNLALVLLVPLSFTFLIPQPFTELRRLPEEYLETL